MLERTQIERLAEGRIVYHDGGADLELAPDTPVSMNLFGFTPDYFAWSESWFRTFLRENGDNPRAEFYIPSMVNKLIADGTAEMRVLRSSARWFGVTYKEDRPSLVTNLRRLIDEGVYPEYLWK